MWFRRQVPLGRFIVDVLAPRVGLVVEVDAGYHATRASADARRDQQIGRLGYRTLRLAAELIRRDMPTALARIQAALRAGAPI